jgi:copper resistance protein D
MSRAAKSRSRLNDCKPVLTQLLDVFGLLSVVLRGGALASQSLVLGGAVFTLWILRGLPGGPRSADITQSCRRLVLWSAAGSALIQSCYLAADTAVLAGTANLGLADIAGAHFFIAGSAGICAATAVAAAAMRRNCELPPRLLALAAVSLAALVMTSHAPGRLDHRLALCALTALHQAATAFWIGGIPYLVLGLAKSQDPDLAQFLCRKFSRMSLFSVGTLAASGSAMSLIYVGSFDAIYGAAYGAMVASKVALLGILLLLGALNFFITHQPSATAASLLPCLRRLAEAEIGIGFTVIFAAASLTSQPPAVDLPADRVSAAEIVQRMSPRWPRLHTPELSGLSPPTPLGFDDTGTNQPRPQSFVPGGSYSPNTPGDIAWSEYNHHWAGLIVLIAGLLAVLARSGAGGWARHWPLTFLGLAVFLFVAADPENWPLGPRSFWQSFAVAEVLEHRVFVLLIVAFAGFEWSVQTGRITSPPARLVFPSVCAAGGALLLTHSHSLGNAKEELLAELSHILVAIFGVTAGWARWLELRLPPGQRRIPAWIWPVCFSLIGIVLLNYRES